MAKYKIVYTDDLPEGVGGRCEAPIIPMIGTCVIKIRPKYKDDIGLLKHEIKHSEQYSKCFFHGLMYNFFRDYRLECELDAYKCQIDTYGYTTIGQAMWIVNALYNKYNLDMSIEDLTAEVKSLLIRKG